MLESLFSWIREGARKAMREGRRDGAQDFVTEVTGRTTRPPIDVEPSPATPQANGNGKRPALARK
jgi:hypothetical protein